MNDMTADEPLFKPETQDKIDQAEAEAEPQDDYRIFPTVEPPFLDEETEEDDHGGTECHLSESTPRKFRILSEDAAQALYAQAKAGNKAARNELIERFWPLCNKIAKQYRDDLPHDEATTAAMTGLIAVIDGGKFDPTMLDRRGKPIKLAGYFWQWLYWAVWREKDKRFDANQTSLDAPRSADGEEFAPDDAPPAKALSEAPPTLEDDLIGVEEEAAQDGAVILYSLNTLDDRDRQIFEARCLVEGDDRLKLRELAAEHGLTSARISQIALRTQKKIADAVREQVLRPRKLCDLGLTPAAAASLQLAMATLTEFERHVFTCRRLTRFPARYVVVGRAFGINGADCLDVEIDVTLKIYRLVPAALVQLRRAPERRVSPVTRVLDERELLDIGLSPETAADLTPGKHQWLGWIFGSGRLVSSWPSEEDIAAVRVAITARRKKAAAEKADWRAVLLRSRTKREGAASVSRAGRLADRGPRLVAA